MIAGNIAHANRPSPSKIIRRALGDSEFSRLLTRLHAFSPTPRRVDSLSFLRREQAGVIRQSGGQRIVGSFNNAAVGTALGQANGIQALDRGRQVIVLTGDGGFNMLMGEFMTAVHHKLPVKVVIFNNAALGLITLEAQSVGIVPFKEAIEFPNPDFAALARACGAKGFSAKTPQELPAAIVEALNCEGPAIVDCLVASDEMPNIPHLEFQQITGYAKARIREAIAAVMGGG